MYLMNKMKKAPKLDNDSTVYTFKITNNGTAHTEKKSYFKWNLFILLLALLLTIIIVIIISVCLVVHRRNNFRNKSNFSKELIELSPSYIKGIAGENYTIYLTFPRTTCSEGINLTFTNSYNLTSNILIINVQKNLTKCNFIIHLIQYKMTINDTINEITIVYNGKDVKKKYH